MAGVSPVATFGNGNCHIPLRMLLLIYDIQRYIKNLNVHFKEHENKGI